MTKHAGWLGLLLGLALVPSACGADDDDSGTGGAGAPSAGKGGGSAGKGGGSSGGKGGTGGASGESNAAGSAGEGVDGPLEIAGTWQNEAFGETDVIDADSWSQDFGTGPTVSAIVEFSNSENYAIRKAPHDAAFDPDKFDRTVWTEIDGDSFYYCTPDHGLDTAEEAAASSTAVDADDPDTGCDGFPWTKLTAP